MEAFLGILGVLLGFALGAYYQEHREKQERKRLLVQLREELKANMYMIPQKKATIRSMLDALSDRRILPGESVPFCDAIFRNHFASVAPHISQKERNIYQVVYSNFESADRMMNDFEPAMTSAGDPQALERVMVSYSHRLGDFIPQLDLQKKLIDSLLTGDPIDVLHMNLSYDEVSNAEIKKV